MKMRRTFFSEAVNAGSSWSREKKPHISVKSSIPNAPSPLLCVLTSGYIPTRSNMAPCYSPGVCSTDAGLFSSMKENIHREEIHFCRSFRAHACHQLELPQSKPSSVLSPPQLPQGNWWEMPKFTHETQMGSSPDFNEATQISNSWEAGF